MSCGHVRGSGGMPPWENFKNGFSEAHSGAFSAQYNDGKIVHQNPLEMSIFRVGDVMLTQTNHQCFLWFHTCTRHVTRDSAFANSY